MGLSKSECHPVIGWRGIDIPTLKSADLNMGENKNCVVISLLNYYKLRDVQASVFNDFGPENYYSL